MEEDKETIKNHPNLPSICITNILSRLAVKPLSRFKCVSKSWHFLITHQSFVKNHLNLALNDAKTHMKGLAIYLPLQSITTLQFYTVDFDATTHSVKELALDLSPPYDKAKILGSCNGLLLIGLHDKSLVLWNPSTAEFARIVVPECINTKQDYILSGLGYDSFSDVYGVILVTCDRMPLGDGQFWKEKRGFVFSSKTKNWAEIGSFGYGILPSHGVATVFNGTPHWLVTSDCVDNCKVIISFAFARFQEILLPGGLMFDVEDLTVLKGRLCVVQNCYGSHFEIWAMKEYGVVESWTSLLVIPNPNMAMCSLKPFCLTANGQVLMEIDKKRIVVHNLESDTYTDVMFSDNNNGFYVATYVESLVSPNCFGDGTKLKSYHPLLPTPPSCHHRSSPEKIQSSPEKSNVHHKSNRKTMHGGPERRPKSEFSRIKPYNLY